MTNWVETHGMECVIALFLYSIVVSVMPAYGTPHFFRLWGYNIIAVTGASAGNVVKHTPVGQKLEKLVATNVEDNEDGTQTKTEVVSTTTPKT